MFVNWYTYPELKRKRSTTKPQLGGENEADSLDWDRRELERDRVVRDGHVVRDGEAVVERVLLENEDVEIGVPVVARPRDGRVGRRVDVAWERRDLERERGGRGEGKEDGEGEHFFLFFSGLGQSRGGKRPSE